MHVCVCVCEGGGSLGTRPLKNRKEGVVNGAGLKSMLRNVRDFINCVLAIVSRAF